MNNVQNIVVIGATSAMAIHCARLWANEASNFILVGRNQEKLDRVAKDLCARSPQSTTKCIVMDFNDQNEITDLAEKLGETLTIDKVLIAHGTLPIQADCQSNISEAHQALLINGVSPSLFAEAFAKVLEKQDYGNIILISSVAGDRGRKSNYVYGSAKGLVTRYAQGLQHRLHKTNVNLLLVKPGPTSTPMTAHLEMSTGLAKVEDVAKDIVKADQEKKSVLYTPKKWNLIMLIIKLLPSFIFNKTNI